MGTGRGGGGRTGGRTALIPGNATYGPDWGPTPHVAPDGTTIMVNRDVAGETLWGAPDRAVRSGKAFAYDPVDGVLSVSEFHAEALLGLEEVTGVEPYLDSVVQGTWYPPGSPAPSPWIDRGGSLPAAGSLGRLDIYANRMLVGDMEEPLSESRALAASRDFMGVARGLGLPAGTPVHIYTWGTGWDYRDLRETDPLRTEV